MGLSAPAYRLFSPLCLISGLGAGPHDILPQADLRELLTQGHNDQDSNRLVLGFIHLCSVVSLFLNRPSRPQALSLLLPPLGLWAEVRALSCGRTSHKEIRWKSVAHHPSSNKNRAGIQFPDPRVCGDLGSPWRPLVKKGSEGDREGRGQGSVGSGSDQMAGAGEQVNRCAGQPSRLLPTPSLHLQAPPSLSAGQDARGSSLCLAFPAPGRADQPPLSVRMCRLPYEGTCPAVWVMRVHPCGHVPMCPHACVPKCDKGGYIVVGKGVTTKRQIMSTAGNSSCQPLESRLCSIQLFGFAGSEDEF